MRASTLFALLSSLMAVSACGYGDGLGPTSEQPIRVQTLDCIGGQSSCPELLIAGDAAAQLEDGRPAPARGFADPSIRSFANTIWMAYSWPFSQVTQSGATTQFAVRVDSHLARSTDNGASWRFVRELWKSTAAVDESGAAGWLNSEVVSLAPHTNASWYSVRLRYFVGPAGTPKVSSFTLQVAAATSPELLASATEATLGGAITHPRWQPTVNLAALSPELAGCTWNDPGLIFHENALYLATQCSLFVTGEEPVEREFVAVFSTTPVGSATSWQWRYLGKLAGFTEAQELGGQTLLQTDLAYGSDGKLLAIFSPSAPATPLDAHFGCRVVEVASLEPPRLARSADGKLRVRASITATDLLPGGPGACGYDAESATGVVIVRRSQQPGQLVVRLHRSGIRP